MLARGVAACVVLFGCTDEPDDVDIADEELASCPIAADVYTPFATGHAPSGPVAMYPWRGTTAYPDGDEDFRGYALPEIVECGDRKVLRSHLDVTAGCLEAVAVGAYTRGRITSTGDGAFRAVALPRAPGDDGVVKWTDQSIEFRFFHDGANGPGTNPGWKAFARYRDEDDLYVASWRLDGVVQIQKKRCGAYTALAVSADHGAPTPHVWHHMRLDAVGNRLDLYLDGVLTLSTTSGTFSWGTMGIRADAMTGAYIDDWRVQSPP